MNPSPGHWYAGQRSDNKKHPHVSPMNALVHDALQAYGPDIWGPGWIFPAAEDPTKHTGYHVAKRWLSKAEKYAELDPQKGSAWHAFRRGWATARKHVPAKDAAVAGGWKDTATMQRCYVKAEGSGVLAAVNGG